VTASKWKEKAKVKAGLLIKKLAHKVQDPVQLLMDHSEAESCEGAEFQVVRAAGSNVRNIWSLELN